MNLKKLARTIAIVSAAALVAGEFVYTTDAVSFDSLDQNTAVAGASVQLRSFYQSNEGAEDYLYSLFFPEETVEETEEEEVPLVTTEILYYDMARIGRVGGTNLNFREAPDFDSEVIGSLIAGSKIILVGEQIVKNDLWYVVRHDDVEGFAFGYYVEKTSETYQEPERIELPERLSLPEDAKKAGNEIYERIVDDTNNINYCLRTALPEALETGNAVRIYSVLIYIDEKYKDISTLAAKNGMDDTLAVVTRDNKKLTRYTDNLKETTGMSDNDFIASIVAENEEVKRKQAEEKAAAEEAERKAREAEEAKKAAEEAAKRAAEEAERKAAEEAARKAAEEAEAARKAAEEAEAARKAAEEEARIRAEGELQEKIELAKKEGVGTLGRELADYAATFVGILPYVWGGASLETGADCSGFCGQVLAHFGCLNQSRANWHAYCSGDFRKLGHEVSLEDIQPGDIVCYNGHVAMYFGCGLCVHEPARGRKAEYGKVDMLPIITIRRIRPEDNQ